MFLLLLLYLFIFNGTELSHGDRFPLLKEVRPERYAYDESTVIYKFIYNSSSSSGQSILCYMLILSVTIPES